MAGPSVQRAAGDPHLSAERVGVLLRGQFAGELPALARRELRVDQVLDQAQGGKLWNGPSSSRALPALVPRPDLLRIRDWTTKAYAYRAELYAFAPDPIVSPRPVLDEDPGLPEAWWKEMTAALKSLTDVPPPTDREAVREEYLRRVIPQFTGHQVDAVTWTTAHGDLHYGNLTRGPHILDWEGWGRAPYGYDAATLYVYALLTPETAARIRTELSPVLDRPEAAATTRA
ncbi:hypothetical protein ABT237_41690 [Streptomyces sp. NPDC001581]|uniref:hypothetical protein n=1 Tax=Streptomyces sp. NPDC001581 TaxID=3154386 RepID=UPI0033294B8F